MIRLLKILLIFLLLILFPKIAISLTSSSYLIANAAISLFDYETAAEYFSRDSFSDLNIIEKRKTIISFINSNRFEEAKSIAEQSLKLNNSSEEGWLVALTFAKLNNSLQKFSEFEMLNNNNEFKIINYVFYDNNKMQENHEVIAERLFNLVKEDGTSNINYNDLYNYQNNIDYFLFYLNLSLILKPQFNEALFIKAQIYQELKIYLQAEEIYKKIHPKHYLYVEGQKNIVIIKQNTKKFNEAEKILIKLIDVYPDENSLIVLLAYLYQTKKQYSKAVKFYTLLIQQPNINNNMLWQIYYRRGICYERSNKWKKAENDFLKALEIEPEQPQVLNYLAYGWIEKNFYLEKSINMLKKAIKKNPESHYILDSLAWAHYKKNNFSKAVELMERVIDIAPGEAISLDHLGDIYFSLGRKREAYFMWIQALDLAEPEDDISEKVQIKLEKYNEG